MSDSYVTSKATLKCSCGDRMAKLTVYPDRTIELTVKPMANISDHISMYNISSFGRCHTTKYPPTGAATSANHGHLTPMPCVPGTITDWINGKGDYFLRGKPALLKSSYCRCRWGGIIRIVADGQIDTGPADLSREDIKTEEEMKTETEERLKLDPDAVLDGIQLALDAAGLAPGVGAIPDLLNASISAIRGDWAAAGLSIVAAVPLVGDVATAVKFAKTGVKTAAGKTADAAKGNLCSLSEYRSLKTKNAIAESDNVFLMPAKKASNSELQKTREGLKQDNVSRIDKYERIEEKQGNGPSEITITKKTETIVAADKYNYRVAPVQKNSYTGYGSGNQPESFNQGKDGDFGRRQWGPHKRRNLENKKKTCGLTEKEEELLQHLKEQEKNGSIFNL